MKFLFPLALLGSAYAACPLSTFEMTTKGPELVKALTEDKDVRRCGFKAATGLLKVSDVCTESCSVALDIIKDQLEITGPDGKKFGDCVTLATLGIGNTVDTIFAEKDNICAASLADNACFLSTATYDVTDGVSFDSSMCTKSLRKFACEVKSGRCGAKAIVCGIKTKMLYSDALYDAVTSCKKTAVTDQASDDCKMKIINLVALLKKTVKDVETASAGALASRGKCVFEGMQDFKDRIFTDLKKAADWEDKLSQLATSIAALPGTWSGEGAAFNLLASLSSGGVDKMADDFETYAGVTITPEELSAAETEQTEAVEAAEAQDAASTDENSAPAQAGFAVSVVVAAVSALALY